jgi:6-phosphogluconate dehydrogenase
VLELPLTGAISDRTAFIAQLRNALYAGMILTYAQGMTQLGVASAEYNYKLNPAAVARIWRGGCIIRAALLDDISRAYQQNPQLPNLMVDAQFDQRLTATQADLRATINTAVALGIPIPGLMSALAYFDGYRSAWLPANLIQAQRDYFGAHTYERVDEKGMFHTEWEER